MPDGGPGRELGSGAHDAVTVRATPVHGGDVGQAPPGAPHQSVITRNNAAGLRAIKQWPGCRTDARGRSYTGLPDPRPTGGTDAHPIRVTAVRAAVADDGGLGLASPALADDAAAAKTRGIILSGHTDTVPVDGQDWSSDPFKAHHRDVASTRAAAPT